MPRIYKCYIYLQNQLDDHKCCYLGQLKIKCFRQNSGIGMISMHGINWKWKMNSV